MSVMSKFFACLLIFCLPVALHAQRSYQPGYIVGLSGDTTRGFINYQDWVYNPKSIEFRRVQEGATERLGASAIRSFTVLGRVYRGAIVDIETSPKDIEYLNTDPAFHIAKDTVFLRPVFYDTKSLYHYNHKRKEYFYIENGSGFELLLFKRFFKINGSSREMISNKRYMGQLYSYFSDCPQVQRKLKHVSYTAGRLQEIFIQYYKCMETDPVLFKETRAKDRTTSEFAVIVGSSVNIIAFKGDFAEIGRADYDPSFGFTGGVSWNVFRKDRHKFKLINQLIFSRYKLTGIYNDYLGEYSYMHSRIEWGASNVHWTTMFRYTLPMGRISYFMNVGGGIGFSSLNPNKRVYEMKNYYYGAEEANGPVFKSNYLFGEYAAGLGATYGHFSMELRYTRSSGPFKDNLESRLSAISLLAHYRF